MIFCSSRRSPLERCVVSPDSHLQGSPRVISRCVGCAPIAEVPSHILYVPGKDRMSGVGFNNVLYIETDDEIYKNCIVILVKYITQVE